MGKLKQAVSASFTAQGGCHSIKGDVNRDSSKYHQITLNRLIAHWYDLICKIFKRSLKADGILKSLCCVECMNCMSFVELRQLH